MKGTWKTKNICNNFEEADEIRTILLEDEKYVKNVKVKRTSRGFYKVRVRED